MRTLYILVNEALKMSKGKVAAQVAHAASMINDETWAGTNPRKVIVLSARNAEQMINFRAYLNNLGYESYIYIDEGANEVPPYSITAMAVEPHEDYEDFTELFKGFELYGKSKVQKFFR